MKQELRQIYDGFSKGKIPQAEALDKIRALKLKDDSRKGGALMAAPVWRTDMLASSTDPAAFQYAEHHVILGELPKVNDATLQFLLPGSRCLSLTVETGKNIAQRYKQHALECFERIQAILQKKPRGRVLFQIVVAGDGEQSLLTGLSALLKTAALENPQVSGQLILVAAQTSSEELARYLKQEHGSSLQAVVRYEAGERQVWGWEEITPAEGEEAPIAFYEGGVYLITGGLGRLGLLFAGEIVNQRENACVVLTGRGALTADKQALIETLGARAGRVSYRQVDLANLVQVMRLIRQLQEEYGQLNGIVHSAGEIADAFLLKKGRGEFKRILGPKVEGTYNLDEATAEVGLDFFVLFSSAAGALGNLGQGDYAAANAFMDQFARYRNERVRAGDRRGLTRSINWGLWESGGMKVDPATLARLQQTLGLQPMPTATGIRAFHRTLLLPHDQILVLEGRAPQLRRMLLSPESAPRPTSVQHPGNQPNVADTSALHIDPESHEEKAQYYLRRQFAELLRLPSHKIDPHALLEEYGIDSILAIKLTSHLERTFGPLSKTLFFEYQTIGQLTKYFMESHGTRLLSLLGANGNGNGSARGAEGWSSTSKPARKPGGLRFRSHVQGSAETPARREANQGERGGIAIIGMSGRYPQALNLSEYWENLRAGKDCIGEVPLERWDWREYYSEDRSQPGHHFSKWGGFIAGVDEFDPLFFNISPREAKSIDPQERLFLQHAWMAMEDAGYTRGSLQVPSVEDLSGQVGVYVGVMYSEYQLFGVEAGMRGQRVGIAGSVASIANRVSYVLNLHGPSVALDTMCSSSLSAIHFACQDLQQGRTSLGIAGGVNVSLHPNKYLALSAGQFISSTGQCQSFGEGGDGYIPGEGVGVAVLKRLGEAVRDGDHIYGIIRGSAVNHGGKTNGYTVPNPQAQASAIRHALREGKLEGRDISYIEAHGTGTRLGDPIEIAALSHAMGQRSPERGKCLLGSAKSNIGHCEAAAGMAGLSKVLLQMEHQQIVASLHSEKLNPHIDFAQSGFEVNQELRVWEEPMVEGKKVARIAGISSFGAGGSNAHLIVEEYVAPERRAIAMEAEVAMLLSARTSGQLRQKAVELLEFVSHRRDRIDLVAMAYTLQVGREGMEERLGLKVKSLQQLEEKLLAYVGGAEEIEDGYRSQVKGNKEWLSLFHSDRDLQQTVEQWLDKGKISKLLEVWVKGLEVEWSKLYGQTRPQRISLPTYPFARERYWIDIDMKQGPAKIAGNGVPAPVLHPLLQRNTSELREQRYNSTFSGEEFFLRDHQVVLEDQEAVKVLPPAVYLEMARAAVEQAWPAPSQLSVLELRNVVWAQPIVVSETRQLNIALFANDREEIGYEIYCPDREMVYCQGFAVWSQPKEAPAGLDLEQLKGELGHGRPDPRSFYEICAGRGLLYGSAFQGMVAIYRGSGQVLAQLRLPGVVEETWGHYVLHPSLMSGTLQAAIGLLDADREGTRQLPVPFALDSLRVWSACSREMYVWVRYVRSKDSRETVVKLDIALCDERGNVCVEIRGVNWQLTSLHSGDGGMDQVDILALPAEPEEITIAAPACQELAFGTHQQVTVAQSQPTPRPQAFISLAEPGPGFPTRYGRPQSGCLSLVKLFSRRELCRGREPSLLCQSPDSSWPFSEARRLPFRR